MAKSKSFFGLRRGSTKAFTFQVLNGLQVTKDRVVDVKNPRTRTQMVQRMIMATAGSAYKHMREIVDHSFEGVSYGQRSYSEFMRLNVHDMVEDVRGDLGQFSYNPFGDTGLYPSPFIIARGSLKYNSALAGFYEEPNTVNVQLPTLASDNEKPSVSEQAAAWGLQLGDVLTFAFIYQTSVNNTWGFGFLRIMFRKESDSEFNEDTFPQCFDIDSSLPVHVQGYINNSFIIKLETPVDDELDVFGTTILSQRSNSRWLRSNAQIIFPGSPVNSPTAAEALATYPIGTDYILNGANIGGRKPAVVQLPLLGKDMLDSLGGQGELYGVAILPWNNLGINIPSGAGVLVSIQVYDGQPLISFGLYYDSEETKQYWLLNKNGEQIGFAALTQAERNTIDQYVTEDLFSDYDYQVDEFFDSVKENLPALSYYCQG